MAISQERLEAILGAISSARLGVVGDFAIDAYYAVKKDTGDFSVETGKEVYHGSDLRTSLGAAGNVVQNLCALEPAKVHAFGVVGNDLYGHEMRRLLCASGTEENGILMQESNWDTCSYIKPMDGSQEDNRLDFGTENVLSVEVQHGVLNRLEGVVQQLDAVILNRQFIVPLLDDVALTQVNKLIATYPQCHFFADMRDGGEQLKGATLKVNIDEAVCLLGGAAVEARDSVRCRQLASALSQQREGALILTRGEYGVLYIDGDTVIEVPGIYLVGDTDPVGAGDALISAFVACTAVGASPYEAAHIANWAAAVTVLKVQQTGTAKRAEISAMGRDAHTIYQPYIAADKRHANYLGQSDIERVEPLPTNGAIKHIILDHDGTLSVLREGWEVDMRQVMMECICGPVLPTLALTEHERIGAKIERFIDQTTGIQTIVQMQGLATMVQQEGMVDQVLDAAAYKKMYLARLMQTVVGRLERLASGERDVADFTMRGASTFLTALAQRDLSLYLASGTDEEDVVHEATCLGYAELFNGGIYGSKGNELGDAKRLVLQRILDETGCSGEALLVIGDGPVEIQEGRRVGAVCVGIASDEVRRYGLNLAKRTRLIRAGAHLIIPDFTHVARLCALIFGE